MTQFGQSFQITIKNDLPDFVLAFYHRVVEQLNQQDYNAVLHFDMKEIEERKQSLGEAYDEYVVPFVLTILANVRFDNEKYGDAIATLERILVLQEKMLGKKHPMRGDTLNNLAVVKKKLAPKRIFEIAENDNKSVINIWKVAEEREKNKKNISEEVSIPLRLATFYAPTFEFALKGLEAVYEKQGKHVAAKTLNHYANQRLVNVPDILNEVSAQSEVPPQLPPKRRGVIQASRIPSPLPSPDRRSICQINITVQPPPPPLPARGIGPAPVVPREHYPTMRSSPPLPLPSTQEVPPAKETESSCETMTQGLMELPSVPLAEEDESSIGTEEVPEQTRYLERMVAELQAEIAEKARRLAEAERTIETHGAFCCICRDEVANQMWSGCNHLAACSGCAETLLRTEENRSDGGVACPKC